MVLPNEMLQYGFPLRNQLWRVSQKRFDPMLPPPREVQRTGRFDDPHDGSDPEHEGYSVLYCSESATGSLLEVLPRFRPNLAAPQNVQAVLVLDVTERDEFLGEMKTSQGVIPVDWRERSHITNAETASAHPLFDLTSAAAVQFVREELAIALQALGLADLDFGVVLGSDKRITRAISKWIWTTRDEAGLPVFSGVRYRSRFDTDNICQAIFSERFEIIGDISTEPLTADHPALVEAASILRLEIG